MAATRSFTEPPDRYTSRDTLTRATRTGAAAKKKNRYGFRDAFYSDDRITKRGHLRNLRETRYGVGY